MAIDEKELGEIRFPCTKYIDGEWVKTEAIVLPRTDFNVGVSITTFVDTTPDASHFYATLNTCNRSCKIINDVSESRFTGNEQPEETWGKLIDATIIAKKNIYGDVFGRKSIEVRKGHPTVRFLSIEECIEAVELTFKELYGLPWILVEQNTNNLWPEYKKTLLKEYSIRSSK